jgi:hypothetical protein
MDLERKVSQASNIAVFCRNHFDYLESAVKIGTKNPSQQITFRASTTWKSAKLAIDMHGPIKIYFATIKGGDLVKYEATLEQVEINVSYQDSTTNKLLKKCLEETRDEGLWEKYGQTVNTLYVISGCRKLTEPFRYNSLTKLSDDLHINENYGYSYSLVYERCPKCLSSPCRCSK